MKTITIKTNLNKPNHKKEYYTLPYRKNRTSLIEKTIMVNGSTTLITVNRIKK